MASERPAYRAPWTAGAYAYPEADTFAAAKAGMTRKRNDVLFHMPNTGEAGDHACAVCGGTLRDLPVGAPTTVSGAPTKVDRWSTWDYQAKTKRVGNGRHYVCSWSALISAIFRAHDAGIL